MKKRREDLREQAGSKYYTIILPFCRVSNNRVVVKMTDRRNTCRKNPCDKNPCRKNHCQKDSCEKNTCEKITAKIKSLPTKIPAEKNTCEWKSLQYSTFWIDQKWVSMCYFWSQMKPRMKVYSFISIAVDGAFGSYSKASGGRLASLAYTHRR